MKIKKIISLLLAVILTFGIATSAFAVQENDDSELSLLYTFIGSMSSSLDVSGTTLDASCDFVVPDAGNATLSITIKRSATGNGGWTTYDSYVETVTCPYDGIIEKNFYSAPSGYYYAIVTLRVKDSATGRSESTTQYTGTVHI